MSQLETIINQCKELAFDLTFQNAKKWKYEKDKRILVGYLPIYFPREIVHAAGGLAVGIMGTGDRKQVVKGDAYFQSYICRMPRGIIEMALDNNLDDFDGFVFPSICDVIRNLSGMFKILDKGTFVKYLDFPQNFQSHIGGSFYKKEMQNIIELMGGITGTVVTSENLNHSISLYNKNRQLLEHIYSIRQEYPWRISMEDVYYVIRAGQVIPVEEHNDLLEKICDDLEKDIGKPQDRVRVVVSGSFCEQPPIGLIKSIEMAGCYVIDWVQDGSRVM